MRPILVLLALLAASATAVAQDKVNFASMDGKDGAAPTQLDGYLFRPNKPGPYPAVVSLHGCGGLISAVSHQIVSREMEWAGALNRAGYAVLMVDILTPRGSGEICSTTGFKEWLYLRRPADAYGAPAWLQQQPFIARDRVAMMGWSAAAAPSCWRSVGSHRASRRTLPDPTSAPPSPSIPGRAVSSAWAVTGCPRFRCCS